MGLKPRPSRTALFMISYLRRVFHANARPRVSRLREKQLNTAAIDEAIRTAQFVRNKLSAIGWIIEV
jgi:hypothetical protein